MLAVFLSRQNRTKGGESDSDVKAFTVSPTGVLFSVNPVTTVMPVAKWPRTLLNFV